MSETVDETADATTHIRARYGDRLATGLELSHADRRAMLDDLLIAGYSPQVAAAAVNMSQRTGYYRRAATSLQSCNEVANRGWAGRTLPPELRAEAGRRALGGELQDKIAADLGIAPSSVSRCKSEVLKENPALVNSVPRSSWHWKSRHLRTGRIIRETATILDGLVSSVNSTQA